MRHYIITNANLQEFIEKAQGGDAEIQYRLSYYYKRRNYVESMRWLKLAADQGYTPAIIDLGKIYLSDEYGVKDLDKAEQYFIKASELGDTDAMDKIGISYYCYKHYNEAIKWFKLANNYTHLGHCYFRGYGVDQSYEEAFKCYLAAKNNDRLAMCYFYGYGVAQNYDEAFKYYLAADDKLMLGECYLNGLGVERNVGKTIELWEEGAELPSYVYIEKLAHLYGDGVDMVPDHEKALNLWFEMVHEDDEDGKIKGSVEAMYQIACYYYEGKGVKKSVTKALKWFKHAIDMLYLEDGTARYEKYDRELHDMVYPSYKVDSNCYISQEPDFIIHARKILIKHGQKSIINKTKKAAQLGDVKAAEILNEFGIEYIVPKQPELAIPEVKDEPVIKAEPKREPPIPVFIGDILTHTTFGEGVVCEVDDDSFSVEFTHIGKKKFLNPMAFNKGFLTY